MSIILIDVPEDSVVREIANADFMLACEETCDTIAFFYDRDKAQLALEALKTFRSLSELRHAELSAKLYRELHAQHSKGDLQ